jgi:hypothetical protein
VSIYHAGHYDPLGCGYPVINSNVVSVCAKKGIL